MIDSKKREAIYLMHQSGMTKNEISRRLGIDRKTVVKIIKQKGCAVRVKRKDRIEIDQQLLSMLYPECNGEVNLIHEKLKEDYNQKIGYSTLTQRIRETKLSNPKSDNIISANQDTMFWIQLLYPVMSNSILDATKYLIEQCSKKHQMLDGRIIEINIDMCKQKLNIFKQFLENHSKPGITVETVKTYVRKATANNSYKKIVENLPVANRTKSLLDKPLSEGNIEYIEKHWKNGKKIWKQKTMIITLAHYGYNKVEIKNILEISKNSVKRYINKYNLDYSVEIKLNKRKDHKLRVKRVVELLHSPPSEYGINRTVWCAREIKKVYMNKYNENIGKSTIRSYINDSGYTFKKAKYVLTSNDPNYIEKVTLLLKVIHSLGEKEELFFIDEAGPYRVKRYHGRRLMKKDEPAIKIPKNQIDKGSITLFAAIGAKSNRTTWLYHNAKDTNAMKYLIEILFNQYFCLNKFYITWDAASWHSSNELTEWIDAMNTQTNITKKGPIINLVPLPSTSQFLNIIESIFSGMKRAVILNSDYQSEIEMKTAVSRHFSERNDYFKDNPKRLGKKIWEIDFFQDYDNLKSGNYREY